MEFAVALASVVAVVGGLTLISTLSWLVRSNLGGKERLPPVKSGWIPWVGCAIPFGKEPLWFIQQTRKEVSLAKPKVEEGVFSGEEICGGLGLMYCSVVKPDTCKWLSSSSKSS